MTKILLIEEQNLFRHSLESLINTFDCCEITKTHASLGTISKAFDDPIPDLILISVYNIIENAEIEIQKINDLFPLSKVVVMSEKLTRSEFSQLVELDVYGFFSINAPPSELEQLLCSYNKFRISNQMFIDSYSRECLRSKSNYQKQEPIEFSEREFEVLNLVCLEKTNCEISKTLGLSVRTIESYRRQMITKLGCRNMVGVIMKTLQCSNFRRKYVRFMA